MAEKTGSIIKPRSASGLADYTEAENVALSKWLRTVENEYRLFGFSRLIPRPMELREVLLSKGGIQKLIYGISRLHNDAPTDLALPFDRTVPLANWIARRQGEVSFPYKRYDISYSHRGERSQAGRFQSFFQADVDIIGQGKLDPGADSEIITVIFSALKKLGFKNMYVCLNDLALTGSLLRELQIPEEKHGDILRIIDSIFKISKDDLLAELKAACAFSDAELSALWELFSYQGTAEGFADILKNRGLSGTEAALGTVVNTVALLETGGVEKESIVFCPAIVRGLDYYTGIVFETFLRGYENIGSIASGGRYDSLASTFTKSVLPGVGGTIGLTRLFYIAVKNGLVALDRCTEAEFFVGFRDPSFKNTALKIARGLRERGFYTDLYSGTDNFKKQLSWAGKKGFEKGIFVMDENSIIMKNLLDGTQEDFAATEALFARLPEKCIRENG